MAENTNAMTEVKKENKPAPSLGFMNLVAREFAKELSDKKPTFSERQKRLIQGYFVMVDRALITAEENRLKNNGGGVPYKWDFVNMRDLALDAAHYARMGLDMQEKNHLFPIPFANKRTGKYDINFMLGYSGIQYIAEKYALTPPKNVTIEIVHEKDKFKVLKKSFSNPVESYEFEFTDPFDRGEIKGGFGYIEYDDPSRNELIVMSKQDILKRVGKNSNTSKWQEEMFRKTLVREVYSGKHIPRDPSKIDDDYEYMKEREVIYAQAEIESEAKENANSIPLDIPPEPLKLPEPD